MSLHNSTRAASADSEKITINLGHVDLGHVDLLVSEGFYANRTDLIRTAIRNQLERHGEALRQSVARRNLSLGIRHITRDELERLAAAGEHLDVQVLGLARFDDDITPDLARCTIASIRVLGALQISASLRATLRDRIH